MYSKKGNQLKNKSNPVQRKEKPRPQWTTDFTDYDKYKLSQAEMIQKKAALQSKHRQQAKNLLQQRRRKLEMGIIDQQTKKVFQTALLSKNIDINPPIRKNLTQMIQYQRQQQQNMRSNQQQSDEDNESDENEQNCEQNIQRDLKQAQNFIKKFEKAKKQPKIQRAMQIILQDASKNNQQNKKSIKQSKVSPMTNNFINNKQGQNQQKKSLKITKNKQIKTSNEDALSSIQDTIRFMEEKLFAAKKTVNESFVSKQNENDVSQSFDKFQGNNDFRLFQDGQNKFNQQQDQNFSQNFGELSHLKINLKNQQNSDQDECMDTIRRMRQMIDSKQDFYSAPDFKKQKQNRRDDNFETTDKRMNISPSLGFTSTIQKNSHNFMESEAEVDFSLTQNNDQPHQLQQKNKKQYFIATSNLDAEYQKLKQNLFNQVQSSHQNIKKQNRNGKQKYNYNYNYEHEGKYKVENLLQNQEDFIQDPSFSENQFKKKCFQTQILKDQQYSDDNMSYSNISKVSKTKKTKKNKSNKISQEVEAMKNMIENMKVNIQTTKIQPLKIDHKDPVIGFDFRGSINIKKNIITK